MDEPALIGRILRAAATPLPAGTQGSGDDCAVLPWRAGHDLVATTDAIAEEVHFWAASDARQVGRFAAAVNLSDLAAAGAEPRAFLLAACVRRSDTAWMERVAEGVGEMLRRHGTPLVGGDTKEAASRVLVGTAFGEVPSGAAVGRGGARPGDVVVVSGALGRQAVWLDRLAKGDASVEAASAQVLDVEPRLAEGRILRECGAHAMTDLSDGLARGATLIAERSKARIILQAGDVPVAPEVRAYLGEEARPAHPEWRRLVLATGGEYELLATLPAAAVDEARRRVADLGVPLVVVGEVSRGEGAWLRATGQDLPLAGLGWRHFRPERTPAGP